MREYVGPTELSRWVTFVAGEPPRLVAITREAVYVWEVGRPDPVTHWPLEDGPGSAAPVGSADGRWLAVLLKGRVTLYDLRGGGGPVELSEGGAVAVRFAGRPEQLWAVRLADPGANAVLTLDCWAMPAGGGPPVPRGVTTRVLPSPENPWPGGGPGWDVNDLSADRRRFAASIRGKAAHVWDTAAGVFLGTVRLRGLPCGLAFAPDGSRLVIDAGTTLYVHHADTLEPLAQWKAKYSYAPGLAWSPDGRLLARTDNSTTVRVYDVASGRQVSALGTKRGRQECVAFAPDGMTFATGTWDGPVRVWDVEGA